MPANARRVLVAAVAAVIAAFGLLTLILGFSAEAQVRALQMLAVIVLGAVILTGVIGLSLVHFAQWQTPEDDFERIVRRAERLAAEGSWGEGDDDSFEYEDFGAGFEGRLAAAVDVEHFNELVRAAIDELPLEFHRVLEHVAIVIGDGGANVRTGGGSHGVYGLYQGGTVTQSYFHDRIVIFRDTLIRDFGHDPDLLREQVVRTVRHELAHHLGLNERGVSDLGL